MSERKESGMMTGNDIQDRSSYLYMEIQDTIPTEIDFRGTTEDILLSLLMGISTIYGEIYPRDPEGAEEFRDKMIRIIGDAETAEQLMPSAIGKLKEMAEQAVFSEEEIRELEAFREKADAVYAEEEPGEHAAE